MIKGSCFSKLDFFDSEDWPIKFVSVPRKGEFVYSQSGMVLVVKKIIHCGGYVTGLDPCIKVELQEGL